jgi:hypothetical protein
VFERGQAWELLSGGTAGKWLSVRERREVIENWLDRYLGNDFHGIQIFPKWLPLGPVISIATFVELVLSGLILFCAGFAYFLGPYFWPIIVLLKWTLSMLLVIAVLPLSILIFFAGPILLAIYLEIYLIVLYPGGQTPGPFVAAYENMRSVTDGLFQSILFTLFDVLTFAFINVSYSSHFGHLYDDPTSTNCNTNENFDR